MKRIIEIGRFQIKPNFCFLVLVWVHDISISLECTATVFVFLCVHAIFCFMSCPLTFILFLDVY